MPDGPGKWRERLLRELSGGDPKTFQELVAERQAFEEGRPATAIEEQQAAGAAAVRRPASERMDAALGRIRGAAPMIASMVSEPIGMAVDAYDVGAGILGKDPARAGFGLLGLALPFVGGRALQKVSDMGEAAGRGALNRAGNRGSAASRMWEQFGPPHEGRAFKKVPVGDGPVKAMYQFLGDPEKFGGVAFPDIIEVGGEKGAKRFHRAITDAKQANKAGAAVYAYSPEEYAGMRLFLTPDGSAGFALKGDEMVSLFKADDSPHRGFGTSGVRLAIEEGGRRGDAFDTVLPGIYADNGLSVTGRIKWSDEAAPDDWDKDAFSQWNGGEPDVVAFRYDPDAPREYTPGQGRDYEGNYDAMVNSTKTVEAPAVHTVEGWKPESRGVFDRSAPKIQAQVPSDPRLAYQAPQAQPSLLAQEAAESKVLRRLFDKDVKLGLLAGGEPWYELGPLKASLGEIEGAIPFEDWNRIGGAISANNSVANEMTAMSLFNWARKRGVGYDEAMDIFRRMTGGRGAPLMPDHWKNAERALDRGLLAPARPRTASWKTAMYADKRLGGGGVIDVLAPGGMPAIDTHERRRLWQAVLEDPSLWKLAKKEGMDARVAKGLKGDDPLMGQFPMINHPDYQTLSRIYTDGAKRWDLPSAGAYQAARWLGGGNKTGLDTQAYGDYIQLLEDAIAATSRNLGQGTSPAELRKLWKDIARGDEFIRFW